MMGLGLGLYAAAAVFAAAASPALTGAWGGDQTLLTLGPDGGKLQASCAQGAIATAVRLDAHGRFKAHGEFLVDTAGPQDADQKVSAAAMFSGRVTGDSMNLTVRPDGGAKPLHFKLQRGVKSKIVRCL